MPMSGSGRSVACEAEPLGVSALAMLARETQVRRGPVPCELGGKLLDGECQWLMAGERIVLRGDRGIRLAYERGRGVTLDAPPEADPRDAELWLNGTIYAAVAALNGLMPLHASAVAYGGQVYAFTGPPGAGKSTLAAALGREGLPLFCDDTLILDLSRPDLIVGLPGHKRLKLWPEGVALAGAQVQDQVQSDYPKYFAQPAAGIITEPLPLAELIFLEQGESPALLPVAAGERIARLQDDHYTAELFEHASRLDRPQRFAQLAAIAARIPMRRFARPFAADKFDEGLTFMASHICKGSPA